MFALRWLWMGLLIDIALVLLLLASIVADILFIAFPFMVGGAGPTGYIVVSCCMVLAWLWFGFRYYFSNPTRKANKNEKIFVIVFTIIWLLNYPLVFFFREVGVLLLPSLNLIPIFSYISSKSVPYILEFIPNRGNPVFPILFGGLIFYAIWGSIIIKLIFPNLDKMPLDCKLYNGPGMGCWVNNFFIRPFCVITLFSAIIFLVQLYTAARKK